MIRIDPNVCAGHARCLALLPAALTFDDEAARAQVRSEAAVQAIPRELLLRVVRSCPERAITLTDEDDR